MTVLTAQQMADAYFTVNAPVKRIVAWLAVALAESSWETTAVSPADARGLYQIEPFNFPATGLTDATWTDPVANTRAMLILSGGGMNFAPWDTAYANIGASGRLSFLGWPQDNSAAFNDMPQVAGQLGPHATAQLGPPPQPGLAGGLPDALTWYAAAANSVVPTLAASARGTVVRARRSYLR